MLKDNLKKLLDLDDELVITDRSNGVFSMKISSITLIILDILYIFSSIDIVPECVMKPKSLAYIDDLIITILVGFYVVKDLYFYLPKERRELNVQPRGVSKKEDASGESTVSNRDDSIPESDNVSNSDTSSSDNNDVRFIRTGGIPNTDSTTSSTTDNSSFHNGDYCEEGDDPLE